MTGGRDDPRFGNLSISANRHDEGGSEYGTAETQDT